MTSLLTKAANFAHLAFGIIDGRNYGHRHCRLTVSRPLQTPPRPIFYILPSHDQNGHVVAPQSLLAGSGSSPSVAFCTT